MQMIIDERIVYLLVKNLFELNFMKQKRTRINEVRMISKNATLNGYLDEFTNHLCH